MAATGLTGAVLAPWLSAGFLVVLGGSTALALRARGLSGWLAALPVLAPPLLYWSLSGMENSLYALALLALVLALAHGLSTAARPMALAGAALAAALVTLTRPEGVFVALCMGGGTLLALPARRVVLRLGAAVGAGAVVALLLRLALGLRLFPNPVYAKQSIGLSERLSDGVAFAKLAVSQMPASSAAAALLALGAALLWLRARRAGPVGPVLQLAFTALLATAAATGFAVLSGGDWMENGRFFAPAVFFGVLAGLIALPGRARVPAGAIWIAAVLVDLTAMARAPYGGLPLFAPHRQAVTEYTPAAAERFNTIHARDRLFADRLLAELARDPREAVTIASIQAGLVPYYVFGESDKDLTFVDFYGLVTDHVHGCGTDWDARFDPYADLADLQACVGLPFDYLYDIDADWSRAARLEEMGCEVIVRQDLVVATVPWKEPNDSRMFLAKCASRMN